MTRSAIALFAAVSLCACHQIEGGPELSETRTVAAFTRVAIEDGLTATLSPGAAQVTLNAPEKVVANLVTEVKSGVLEAQCGKILTDFFLALRGRKKTKE